MTLGSERYHLLRRLVNAFFRGKDAYEVLRATVALWLFWRLFAKLKWIMSREGIKAYAINAAMPYIKQLPPVKRKIEGEMKKTVEDMCRKFGEEVTEPRSTLPTTGMTEEELVDLMEHRNELDTKHWVSGKITGSIYHGGQAHYDFIGKIVSKWAFTNPLHPAIHPALRQMDAEVVQMVINMYNGNGRCCGSFTTGGTESILMAMKVYRDWGLAKKGITEPNIVVCSTAHAAFFKAGQYFNIFVRQCRATAEQQVDVRHMQSLIDSNTVAIVGSCCQFATGAIDPIEEMATLALAKNIGLHVDCCLGGFLVPFMTKAGFPLPPFDFRVKGVTSISCDPHKYGFAPKGASVVMFSDRSWRHHMYSCMPGWTGGIYGTPSMTGSRAGGVVAGTWASMCKFGEEGYIETTKRIVGATRAMAAGIRQIKGLRIVGRPDVCVVAFDATKESGLNCYAIADCMRLKFHWDLATCQSPACVHLAVTLPSSQHAERFVDELRESVEIVAADKLGSYSSTAGLYGMAASLPAQFIEVGTAAYLDAMSETQFGT